MQLLYYNKSLIKKMKKHKKKKSENKPKRNLVLRSGIRYWGGHRLEAKVSISMAKVAFKPKLRPFLQFQ